MSPIAAYLEELALHLRRRRRRRILEEVQAHLLEAVAADPGRLVDPERAARRAIERFGPPARVASQFNSLRPRPFTLAHRTAAVMLASVTMATLGTATVWAIEPGAAATHHHPHPSVTTHRIRAHHQPPRRR